MNHVLAALLLLYACMGFVTGLINVCHDKTFPIYSKNNGKFSNFTIADFLLFTPLIPFWLIFCPFISGKGKVEKFFNKRPLRKQILKVGDKVICAGQTRTVLEVGMS
jgi:hypothetical protein